MVYGGELEAIPRSGDGLGCGSSHGDVILSEAKDLQLNACFRSSWMAPRTHRWDMRQFYVYILASRSRQLYVGGTSNIHRRVHQHRCEKGGFTGRYRIRRLVYIETANSAMAAIAREKQIKGWVQARKVALIATTNPAWNDLGAEWFTPGTADPSLRSG